MAKTKGTCGNFREHVEELTPPLPKGKQAKKDERKRRKEKSKGAKLTDDALDHYLRIRRASTPRDKSTRKSRDRQIAKLDRSQQW